MAKPDRNMENLFTFHGQPPAAHNPGVLPGQTISINAHTLYRLKNIPPGEIGSQLCTSHVPLHSICPFHSLTHSKVESMGLKNRGEVDIGRGYCLTLKDGN